MGLPFVLALAGIPASGQDVPALQLTFLDVGQGDAIVVRSPEGRTALIDAGPSAPLRFLQQMGVDSLDLVIASHPHRDHIGGMVDVVTARPVRAYLDNGVPRESATYERLMTTLALIDGVTRLAPTPRTLTLGSASIEVLPLPPDGLDVGVRSVGLVVRYGDFSALLPGDAERPELDFWTEGGVLPDVTLLKAAHHGSVRGFTRAFLDAARPELVVVSVGADNRYGHPRSEALAAFGAVAGELLRTDRDGHVTVFGHADGSWRVVLGSGDSLAGDGRLVAEPAAPDGTTPPGSADGLELEVVPRRGVPASEDLNTEYAVLANRGPGPVELGGLRLCDLRTRCFRFPPGSRIGPGARIRVYSGYGTSDGVAFFMNNDQSVWNADGDEARLLAEDGRVLHRHVY